MFSSSEFKKLRNSLNLSQRQVAEAIGVTDQTVSNWERGKNEPRLTLMQTVKLAKLFELNVEKLVNRLVILES